MYLLELYQNHYSKDLVAFESLEEGKEFVSKISGYTLEKENQIEVEYFNPKNLPDYMEIVFNGNIAPLSRFSFEADENVNIIWKEISNLSLTNNKVIEGATKTDAYVVNNEEVKTYVEDRETKYNQIKDFLESNGFEVDRSYFGSEDGEAIICRKKESADWHFLCHLDPSILDINDIKTFVKEMMEDVI